MPAPLLGRLVGRLVNTVTDVRTALHRATTVRTALRRVIAVRAGLPSRAQIGFDAGALLTLALTSWLVANGLAASGPAPTGPAGASLADASGRPTADLSAPAGSPTPSASLSASSTSPTPGVSGSSTAATTTKPTTPSRQPTPKPTAARPTVAPPPGVGVFQATTGSSPVFGAGTRPLKLYRVEVEQAAGIGVDAVAASVDSTFADLRGWITEGWRFQRVDAPVASVQMVIRVATPATVDKICAQYGMNTGGVVSCQAGKYLMLNLTRWTQGIPAYAGHPQEYQHLVVNHEAGHLLGYGHAMCPGPGRPAPVMMQQYYGLNGCAPNVWPYTANGLKIG